MAGSLCLSLLAGIANPGPPAVAYYDVFDGAGANAVRMGQVWVEAVSSGGCLEHWAIRSDAGYTGKLSPDLYQIVGRKSTPNDVVNASSFITYAKAQLGGAAGLYYKDEALVWTANACTAMNANTSQCLAPTPKGYTEASCPAALVPAPSEDVRARKRRGEVAVAPLNTTQVDTGTTQVSFAGDNQAFAVAVPLSTGGMTDHWMLRNGEGLLDNPSCYTQPDMVPPTLQTFVDCTCKWMGGGSDMIYVEVKSAAAVVF